MPGPKPTMRAPKPPPVVSETTARPGGSSSASTQVSVASVSRSGRAGGRASRSAAAAATVAAAAQSCTFPGRPAATIEAAIEVEVDAEVADGEGGFSEVLEADVNTIEHEVLEGPSAHQ